MPVLPNPRHEAFAQAIVKCLASDKPNGKNTQKAAYLAAGYSASTDHSAEVAASRLLRNVEPVVARIRELQEQALARLEPKLDISRETIGKRLRKASTMAEEDRNPAAMATCELGLAKVFHSISDAEPQRIDYNSAQSMHDIGKKLLQSIGFASPDDVSIQRAIELNDTFIDGLQAIYKDAQALTVDQG